MKIIDFIESKQNSGSHLLLTTDSYAIFGNEQFDDLVRLGQHKLRSAPVSLYKYGRRVEVSVDELQSLFQKVISLRNTGAYAFFTIYADDVRRIKQSIKKLEATHLRIWSIGQKVCVTVFDCRDFESRNRIGRKNSLKMNYIEIDTSLVKVFSTTLNSESIKKIPTNDWNLRVGVNGVTEIKPFSDSDSYLIRDQRLIEPVTFFDSASVGQKISFQFHPN